jgi:hypothetical protein
MDLGERAMETGNAAREWSPRPRERAYPCHLRLASLASRFHTTSRPLPMARARQPLSTGARSIGNWQSTLPVR